MTLDDYTAAMNARAAATAARHRENEAEAEALKAKALQDARDYVWELGCGADSTAKGADY